MENEITAKKMLAPVDSLTRMPLPVMPPDDIPSFKNPELANWHHHYHPSTDPTLTSISGLAVRHLRLQLLPVKTHHSRYHDIFEGPEFLPSTGEQRLGHIILGVAGYIPSEAINPSADDPSVPEGISQKTRLRLQQSGEIEVRGHANISTFIKNHLVQQDFSHVNELIIDEFLHTNDMDRKKFLGHWLLAIASELAVEPIEPVYKQALNQGLIISKRKLPNIVKAHINGRATSQKTIKALHKKLSTQRKKELTNRGQ